MSTNEQIENPLLSFNGILCDGGKETEFKLFPRELVLMKNEVQDLFDILSGLEGAKSGKALFCGKAWEEYSPHSECRMRADIGRCFPADHAWVGNLTLRDNIVLKSLYHNILSENELQNKLDDMADRLGVSAFLHRRTEGLPPPVLCKCQWIRAFISKPAVLFLDDPEIDTEIDDALVFRSYLQEFLSDGGAAIWVWSSDMPDLSQMHEFTIRRISL